MTTRSQQKDTNRSVNAAQESHPRGILLSSKITQPGIMSQAAKKERREASNVNFGLTFVDSEAIGAAPSSCSRKAYSCRSAASCGMHGSPSSLPAGMEVQR